MFKITKSVIIILYLVFFTKSKVYIQYVNFFSINENIFIFFFFEKILMIFLFFNNECIYNISSLKNTNNALINVLGFYHPYLLFYYIKKYLLINYKNKNLLINKRQLIITTSIILGVWWSAQELLWGGFWNWDFVEITFLLIIIWSIKYAHSKINTKNILNNTIYFYKILILYLIINRTNYIISQHSFSISVFFRYSNMYWNAIVIISTVASYSYLKKLKSNTLSKITNSFLLYFFTYLIFTHFIKNSLNFFFSNPHYIKMYFYLVIVYYFLNKNNWYFIIFIKIIIIIEFFKLIFKIKPLKSKIIKQHNYYYFLLIFIILFFSSVYIKEISITENKTFYFCKSNFLKITNGHCYNITTTKNIFKNPINFNIRVYKNKINFSTKLINFHLHDSYALNLNHSIIVVFIFSKLSFILKTKN